MTDDLRDRIARAIYEEHTGDSLDEGCEVWPLHDDLADAVLAVLSESERVVTESANGDTAATSPNDDIKIEWDDPDSAFAEHHASRAALVRAFGELHQRGQIVTGPTDEAIRAEAEKRWGNRRTSDRLPNDWLNEGMASGFVLGAMWARERTATTVAQTEPAERAAGVVHDDRVELRELRAEVGLLRRQHQGQADHITALRTEVDRLHAAPTVAPDTSWIAGEILAHSKKLGHRGWPVPCTCGHREWAYEHQAEAVAAADPRRTEGEVKAEALDEAANLMPQPTLARKWLRERAAQLRDEADQ